jgi:hypothetical protein
MALLASSKYSTVLYTLFTSGQTRKPQSQLKNPKDIKGMRISSGTTKKEREKNAGLKYILTISVLALSQQFSSGPLLPEMLSHTLPQKSSQACRWAHIIPPTLTDK